MSIRAINWVLERSEATLGSRLVLIALADCAHPDGTKAFPSVETIAHHARMTRRAAQAGLRKLEQEKHIEATGRTRHGTIVYRIVGMGGVDSSGEGGVADDKGGVVDDRGGVDSSRQLGVDSSPEPFNRHRSVSEPNGPMPEPMGFEQWLQAHCELTKQTPPGVETKARAELARKYGVLAGEGRSLDDLKLASLGAHTDKWRRENGKDFPRNVLVSEQVDELIEKGRRASTKAQAKGERSMVRTKETHPWDEKF